MYNKMHFKKNPDGNVLFNDALYTFFIYSKGPLNSEKKEMFYLTHFIYGYGDSNRSFLTSPVDAISHRSSGSASLSLGQENIGA